MNVPLNIDWQQILLHLLNFVILFAILNFLLYNPVKKFMDKRCEYYKGIDDEAKKNLQQAEEMKKKYAEKLHSVDSEIEEKRQASNKALSEKAAQSMILAKQEADKIISEAYKKAKNERNILISEAQEEITDMVTRATEKIILESGVSESYEQFLAAVERSNENE